MEPVQDTRFVSLLTRDTLALVLAGGRGSRLHELCEWRAKPALYFGGKFRLIDFPLSNCVNSGVRRIGVLTQYKAHSLIRHLVRGWSGLVKSEFGEFLEILPASQRRDERWYAGTADAIWQNVDIIRAMGPRLVLVLAGDHVYKMDYGPMLAHHVESEAEMTVGCIEVPREEATAFGVMAVDDAWRIVGFEEKPASPKPMPGNPERSLASMGIYVFDTEFLLDRLQSDARDEASGHDFGRDVIPGSIEQQRVYAFPFRPPRVGSDEPPVQGYWRDVGTVDAFWSANMELIGVTPELNLYDLEWPIMTYQPQLPPAKFVFDEPERRGTAVDSMVSGGCIVSGARLLRSLLFSSVRIDLRSQVEDAVILPQVEIGRDCRISRAVIDRGCRIPDGLVVGEDRNADAERFRVTAGGVVLVTPEMLGQSRATRAGRPGAVSQEM